MNNPERGNLADLVLSRMEEIEVTSATDLELKRFLYQTELQGDLLQDFLITYDNELDGFKRKLADQVFPAGMQLLEYGFIITPEHVIESVFNTEFAYFDRLSGKVIYTPAEEVLLNSEVDASKIKPPVILPPRNPEGPRAKYGFPQPREPRVFLYGLVPPRNNPIVDPWNNPDQEPDIVVEYGFIGPIDEYDHLADDLGDGLLDLDEDDD